MWLAIFSFPPMCPFPKAELSHASFVWVTDTVHPLRLPATGSMLDLGCKEAIGRLASPASRQLCLGSGCLLPAQARGLRLQVISCSPLLSSPGLSYKICHICIG